jgi:hypothetical protein
LTLALAHDLPEGPATNGQSFVGRGDGQEFGPLTVAVGLVQEFVVVLHEERGLGWEPKPDVDRFPTFADGCLPCFLG